MDDDDISEPHRFEFQIEEMREKKLDFCGCWAKSIDSKGKTIGEIRTPVDPASIRKQLMVHTPFLHPTMMFDRGILKKSGYYNPRMGLCQDYELYLRLISKKFVGGNVPCFLLKLRENPFSSTRGTGWFKDRLDYNLAKSYGFWVYGYRRPSDFLFLIVSPAALLITPKAINTLKHAFSIFKPSR